MLLHTKVMIAPTKPELLPTLPRHQQTFADNIQNLSKNAHQTKLAYANNLKHTF